MSHPTHDNLIYTNLRSCPPHPRQSCSSVGCTATFDSFVAKVLMSAKLAWMLALVGGPAVASAQCYEDTHCFYTCGYGYYQHAGSLFGCTDLCCPNAYHPLHAPIIIHHTPPLIVHHSIYHAPTTAYHPTYHPVAYHSTYHPSSSMVKVPPWQLVPQLGSCASSGRAWRLWAARHSREEAGPLGARAGRLQSRPIHCV